MNSTTATTILGKWRAEFPDIDNSSLSPADKAVALFVRKAERDPAVLLQLTRLAAGGSKSFLDSDPAAGGYFATVAPIPTPVAAIAQPQREASVAVSPAGAERHTALEACPYCNEAWSRFCKETGRRHETSEERAERRWKHLFRRMSLAASFIDNSRLQKKNTCEEDYSVEIVF